MNQMKFKRVRSNVHRVSIDVGKWNNVIMYVIKTSDGYKIDWEGSVGYNPVKPNAVKNLADGTECLLRSTLKPSNYYENEYYNGYKALEVDIKSNEQTLFLTESVSTSTCAQGSRRRDAWLGRCSV